MKEGRKLQIFKSMQKIIESTFDSEIIRKAMMFQMVLLGTAPNEAPGMYRLMNHVDLDRGIWYPEGGIAALPKAIEKIAKKWGPVSLQRSRREKLLTKMVAPLAYVLLQVRLFLQT